MPLTSLWNVRSLCYCTRGSWLQGGVEGAGASGGELANLVPSWRVRSPAQTLLEWHIRKNDWSERYGCDLIPLIGSRLVSAQGCSVCF